MSPYRTPDVRAAVHGPRWGATGWVKFWVGHPRLEWAALYVVLAFVAVPTA